ncbi:zinc finger protein 865-like [Anopheles stephensi]|uniref:C2H2-type domain-containing protein n=1 Tax=Anopheles stephensi TaxID=30069 RepID=A0A182Y096_ANOST|nr:zinc finger protein 865-like [Anopheles stephensi]
METDASDGRRKLPAYYYLQPSKNGDEEAEEELYDSNGTHITSDYLNDVVAESMSDKYTVLQDTSDTPQYKCNECEKILPNTGHLIAHIVVHTGENPYLCSLCQRSFANSTRLKLHLKTHCIKKLHPGLTVTRITKNAPPTTPVPSTSMEENMDRTSPTHKTATFRCIECDQTLPKDILYRHMKQHLQEKNIFAQKPHKCGLCGEAFAKSSTLQQHQEACQASSIKVTSEVDLVPIGKQDAGDTFKKQIASNPILSGLLMKESLEPPVSVTTIEVDHQEESPADGAQSCLQDDAAVELEKEIQESEQPANDDDSVIQNSSAGVGFVISSVATVDQQFLENLAQMELQARSPELEEMPEDDSESLAAAAAPSTAGGVQPAYNNLVTSTTCGLCGKSFGEKFGLRQHMRIMHADTKPFKCPECRKRFTQENALLIHLRVHVSNRPFMCIICYKTFTRATALNGHLSSHSHVALKCFSCEATLPSVQKYAQHIEVNHPQFPEILYRIRAEKPEHERTKLLRRLLLQHRPSTATDGSLIAGGLGEMN